MRMNRRTALGVLASTMVPAAMPTVTRAAPGLEPDFFKDLLGSGKLPPLAERLPKAPRVMNLASIGRKPGRYGGSIRSLIGTQKDIRLMTINGYSRLVGYDEKLNLHPDILESFDVQEGRIFTFKLRDGHKWSDGSLLSAEDFRYAYEDIWLNEDLAPGGPATALMSGDKPPAFEVIDQLTVRYTWDTPNPDFLPALAAAQPLSMVVPSAYLKQFHKKYQDEAKLAELVKKNKVKKWTVLHLRMGRSYRPENPELPTLDPWRVITAPPAEQFVFERNPFFHRVDENGLQLPYIDKVILNVSSSAILPAKVGSGDSDWQGAGIEFSDYTFLKESEQRYPVKVHLWKRTIGSRFSLLPNMNAADPVWRPLLRDVRMRRALSLAINRDEINKAVFYGLGNISSDTLLPDSPLYKSDYAQAWSKHDPDQARALLDELGLNQFDDDGVRILPDGRPAKIVVETAGEGLAETDVLELITDHWRNVGIALFIRTSQRDVFRSRCMNGEIMMSLWSGINNGLATADMNPGDLAPTTDDQLQWPVWGANYLSHGKRGEPPDLPAAVELVTLAKAWRTAGDEAQRVAIWGDMLKLYTDQVFSIGMVNMTPQPVLRSARLQNFPEEGLYGFDPTCYFGVYMPDTFWLADEAKA